MEVEGIDNDWNRMMETKKYQDLSSYRIVSGTFLRFGEPFVFVFILLGVTFSP